MNTQGVAFICCADSLADEKVHAQAEGVLLGLLRHPLPSVQLAVYALMEQMVMEVRVCMHACVCICVVYRFVLVICLVQSSSNKGAHRLFLLPALSL